MTFVELHGFARRVLELLEDESLLGLEIELARNPEVGALIKNGGGLRKVRGAAKGRGKSGGVRVRQHLGPEEYRQRQAAQAVASNETAAARAKLNLTQAQFSELLGVSIDTVQNWEQGRRKPQGAAKVLLRVASQNPEAVLAAVKG